MMRWLLALCLAVSIAQPSATALAPIADVKVQRDGQRWTADYRLDLKAPVWIFAKSILPRESQKSWRLGTVKVLTPGVRLERLGHYDALVATNGHLPPRVRLSFTPFLDDIEAGYDAAMTLGPTSVALYTDAFKLVPMESRAQVLAAPRDEDSLPASGHPTRMTFRDRAGPVLFKGKRVPSATTDTGETYVVFGPVKQQNGQTMTTVIDPRLPPWIGTYLKSEFPKVVAHYEKLMGPAPVGQATLMASWQGATPGQVSLGGSVLPGLVTMVFGGEGVLQPDPRISNHTRWFIAHEASHFWLGQAVSYSHPSESWITEGGADLLAFRTTQAFDPKFDAKARLGEARRECSPFLKNGGVASAFERPGDFRAYYACGAIIALAAEQASGGNFADFVKALIVRHGATGKVTRRDWLALLDERAAGRGLSAAVGDLLDKAHADPDAAIDRFIAIARIGDQFPGGAS
jgi:hypothetical protein